MPLQVVGVGGLGGGLGAVGRPFGGREGFDLDGVDEGAAGGGGVGALGDAELDFFDHQVELQEGRAD